MQEKGLDEMRCDKNEWLGWKKKHDEIRIVTCAM